MKQWTFQDSARSRFQTGFRVLGALRAQRLSTFLPLVLVLFAVALALAIGHAAGPLAPFVYPLF